MPKYRHGMSNDRFLEMVAQPGHKFPAGIGEYDDDRDWAGPANDPKLAAMIPDEIMGVSIKQAAYRHDYDYAAGGNWFTRLIDDRTFRRGCARIVDVYYRSKRMTKAEYRLARKFCWTYYLAVRLGGRKSYNYHKKSEAGDD